MARRSLKASTVGIEKAKRAFKIREWTQEYLASEVGLETRQSIWKFFTGKPIERQSFMEICFQLDLDWQEIAELPNQSLLKENNQDWDNCQSIDTLVQMVRSCRSDKIQAQCATIRLLDIPQPIELEDIYVSTNILNNITSQRWLDIFDLQSVVSEELERFGLGEVCQERLEAIEAVTTYPKLMVLGKPGSGKTTFLQHIATQCNQGKFLPHLIPIFIRLRNFAEAARETGNFSVFNFISQELAYFEVSEQQIQTLLAHGRILILLDGLDEISKDDSAEILKIICKFSEDYYKNQLIITCRISACEYQLEGFREIEIADFDQFQIEAFVEKWFVNIGKNHTEQGKAKASRFMQKLQLLENREIRELSVTPLLLNLACCVFQARSNFPTRRVELYKEALNILLNRWDEARSIKRDSISHNFSLPQKLKLLSEIAATTFKQNRYFFTQSNVQRCIADSLSNLSTTQVQPEILQLNSEAVLKLFKAHGLLVERARGIYSFSHLAFQEYLTARNIIASREPQILEEKLIDLISHLTEPRWRKVFLLTAGMLDNPTYLLQLIKQHIDGLVAFDKQLQEFLIWLDQKSVSVQTPYKSAAIRAFYLTLVLPDGLSLADDLALCVAIESRLASNLPPDLNIDQALNCALHLSLALYRDPTLDRVLALNFAFPDHRVVYNPELQPQANLSPLRESLQQLKEKLPVPVQGTEQLKQWWNANGQAWTETLRSVMLRYRNIGHQWQFSEQQMKVLKQYYTANQLLVNCLNSSCEVSSPVREKILGTLFLPVTRASSTMWHHRPKMGKLYAKAEIHIT